VSSASAEEMYAPRLLYYNQRLFLCDEEALHSSMSSVQEEEEDSEVNLFFFIILLQYTIISYSYNTHMHTVCTK
jgi:glycerol-3-phosphate responsive antiterminator